MPSVQAFIKWADPCANVAHLPPLSSHTPRRSLRTRILGALSADETQEWHYGRGASRGGRNLFCRGSRSTAPSENSRDVDMLVAWKDEHFWISRL